VPFVVGAFDFRTYMRFGLALASKRENRETS
jgi:hypothetical protein